MNETKVIIGIVGFRCSRLIAELVAGSQAWTHENFEFHICENGGSETYSELAADLSAVAGAIDEGPAGAVVEGALENRRFRLPHGQAVVIHRATGNLGYSGGVNVVLRAIEPDPTWTRFWLLNPDAVPHADALAGLLDHMRRGQYGIVGARLVFAGTERVQQYGGRWRWWLGRGLNVGYGAPAGTVPDIRAVEARLNYASGACMLVSREFVREAGPMDERYFLYSEEVDWCLRRGALKIGYAHDAVVEHHHGATIGSNQSMRDRSLFSIYLLERSGLLLTRKFYPYALPLVAITSGLFTLKYLKTGGPKRFLSALQGWAAGLRGEVGFPSRFGG
jgi:N-acetylglucosaminyl-diphospho-decaprenol L-rhamnosyltransferase